MATIDTMVTKETVVIGNGWSVRTMNPTRDDATIGRVLRGVFFHFCCPAPNLRLYTRLFFFSPSLLAPLTLFSFINLLPAPFCVR